MQSEFAGEYEYAQKHVNSSREGGLESKRALAVIAFLDAQRNGEWAVRTIMDDRGDHRKVLKSLDRDRYPRTRGMVDDFIAQEARDAAMAETVGFSLAFACC